MPSLVKLERDLRDSNHKWLTGWILFFLAIIAVAGRALWLQFKSKADQLVEDEVEKSLNGFKEAVAQADTLKNELKEAVGQVNILQDQIRILEKEHAASVLESFINVYYDHSYPQSIEALHDEVLLQVFGDEKCRPPIRDKAGEVLAARKSPQLVTPALKFLNSVVDSDFDWETSSDTQRLPFRFLSFVGKIYTDEAHQELKKFLNRLLTENPKHKHLCLAWTAFYLVGIDVKLGLKDSISLMKKAIPDLKDAELPIHVLSRLIEYFITFNEPEGIQDILTNSLTEGMPDVEDKCLEFLQEKAPEFVEKWKAEKETANTQTEESS